MDLFFEDTALAADLKAAAEEPLDAVPYDPMESVEAQLRAMNERLERQIAALEAMNKSTQVQADQAKRQADAAEASASIANQAADDAQKTAAAADKRAKWSLAVAIASVAVTALTGLLQLLC